MTQDPTSQQSATPDVVREHEPLVLADGRRLALCEVGDPGGTVAFYLHGTGSSRLEVALYAKAAQRHGVRLVAWDRPGTGGSDDQPGRRILDVIPDARAVAASVGAVRPIAVGLSGGGSHVLALVVAGSDVVGGGVAINPGPPAEDEILADLPRQFRVLIKLARDRPKLFGLLTAPMEGKGGKLVQKLFGQEMQRRQLDPLDREVIERPEVTPPLTAAAVEGRRQPRANTKEALMFWHQPWGFSLAEFPVPLDVYAGDKDPFNPFSQRLGRAGARMHRFPGGHVSGFVPHVLDEVMTTVAES